MQPGPQVELTVEPRHRPVGPQEGLLHRVFGGPGLAESHDGVRVERRRVLVDDAYERGGVTLVVGFDQQPFVKARHRHEAQIPFRVCRTWM